MKNNWVLVADSSRARLFRRGHRWDDLEPMKTEDHPRGRAHEGDLVTDDGADVIQRGAKGQRRRSEPQVSPTEHEAEIFARQLADNLRAGRVQKQYDTLALVAAPGFLGKLRAALDEDTRRCVTREIDKDLTQHDDDEIARILEKSAEGK